MRKTLLMLGGALLAALWLASPHNGLAQEEKPIALKTMGSLFFGGMVTKGPGGETFHGDHGYAQFYIPHNAREYPLILWHGVGQSGRSWESTPDGREGYQAILPRRDWPIYIIDQPRRGRAGYAGSPFRHGRSADDGPGKLRLERLPQRHLGSSRARDAVCRRPFSERRRIH
ncbi:MAG: hypothetical protein V8Q84_02645 [Bilophila sp.]